MAPVLCAGHATVRRIRGYPGRSVRSLWRSQGSVGVDGPTQVVVPAHVGAPATSAKQAGRAGDFQREFTALVAAALPPETSRKPVEIWFADEARVGRQGTITRVWAKLGSHPRALRDRRYEWVYLFGAICPARQDRRGDYHAASECRGDERAPDGDQPTCLGGSHCSLGARWGELAYIATASRTGQYRAATMPPYAPELNPVENVGEFMRANFLSHRIWETYDDIVEACRNSWNAQSTATRQGRLRGSWEAHLRSCRSPVPMS
jgi:hypothetical protein